MALKSSFQLKLVQEGGLKRLNQIALKTSSNVWPCASHFARTYIFLTQLSPAFPPPSRTHPPFL